MKKTTFLMERMLRLPTDLELRDLIIQNNPLKKSWNDCYYEIMNLFTSNFLDTDFYRFFVEIMFFCKCQQKWIEVVSQYYIHHTSKEIFISTIAVKSNVLSNRQMPIVFSKNVIQKVLSTFYSPLLIAAAASTISHNIHIMYITKLTIFTKFTNVIVSMTSFVLFQIFFIAI